MKDGEISIDITFTMTADQVKRLARTSGSTEEIIKALVECIVETPSWERGPKCGYVKWSPALFPDEESDWLWEKYDGNPFIQLQALQDLAQRRFTVLDQLADI